MVVGCYVLDLYCRRGPIGINAGCMGPIDFQLLDQSRGHFTGATVTKARKAARDAGWLFHLDGDVSCPWCAGKRKAK